MVAYVGNSPINVVAPAINRMVKARVRLRPIRSPTTPKKRPPSGRNAKATANTANVFKSPTVGSPLGKNSRVRMVARNPYAAKSNHSTKLPMDAAAMTRLSVLVSTSWVA